MSWQVTVTDIRPHPEGLQLRLSIRSERARWIQFATTVVVFDNLDDYMRGYVTSRLAGPPPMQDPDEPLF